MINNIDINEILVSNKFPFCKWDFKYFIGYKDNKEIRPLCIVFLEMSIYKRYSDKTKCMCFMIKDENILMNMTFWEKVIHQKKKSVVNLHIIKISKSWKIFNRKESFQCFHIPITLLDSVYWKDGNDYSCRIFSPPGKNVHKDMLYTIGKMRVSGFRKSKGSILQNWAKHLTDQIINAKNC